MVDYVKSTNFYAKDALVSGDPNKIIKGAEIDVEFNNIATAMASKGDNNSPVFSGTPTAPTAPLGTNTTQIATTAFVLANAVPSGGIIMWSGATSAIPAGFALCNGTNGTPDLRDRFVIGAGNTYAVNSTGGTADAIVVSHTHSTSVSDPGHTHNLKWDSNSGTAVSGIGGGSNGSYVRTEPGAIVAASTGISVGITSTGSSGTNANLPPYLALAYIMKL